MSAYWVSSYLEITDEAKLRAYAELAGPAIIGGNMTRSGVPFSGIGTAPWLCTDRKTCKAWRMSSVSS